MPRYSIYRDLTNASIRIGTVIIYVDTRFRNPLQEEGLDKLSGDINAV